MKFRNLNPGDTFDFISPNRMLNSFFQRCTKTSARGYRAELGVECKVGTINCDVYHVIKRDKTNDRCPISVAMGRS